MIKLVITDLDNTLHDWVGYYVPSFNAMLAELSRETGVDEIDLLSSFRRVHQKHGTSEYSFALQELDVLEKTAETNVIADYQTAIHAFRRVRKSTLRLYPDVLETLLALRDSGKKVIAFTDAMLFYAASRVKQLGIEPLIDGLVARRDHGIPEGVDREDVRALGDDHYAIDVPFIDELDPTVVKPNPEALLQIVDDLGVSPNEALYVGDSLHRDVYMAQEAGVHDAYAEYGRDVDPAMYKRLVEISHWTPEDVARETELHGLEVTPTHRLRRFGELIDVVREIEGGPSSSAGLLGKDAKTRSTGATVEDRGKEVTMAKNGPKGGGRHGAVRNRSQVKGTDGRWIKRNSDTGQFIDRKADTQPFKGVRREK